MTLYQHDNILGSKYDCKALYCLAVMKGKGLDNEGNRLQNTERPTSWAPQSARWPNYSWAGVLTCK